MKILRLIGIVVGVHGLAIVLILANPGCSASKAKPAAVAPADMDGGSSPAAAAATASNPPAPPAIALPGDASAPAPADAGSPPSILYTPTRPGTAAASALVEQPVTGVTPASTYEVQRGDSLWSIAKKHHLKASELAKANHLHTSSALHVGQKLILPSVQGAVASGAAEAPEAPSKPGKSHAPEAAAESASAAGGSVTWTVRSGESLGAIAHRFGVRVGAIAQANSISDPQKIRAGDVLVIPNPKRVPAGAGHQSASTSQAASPEAGAAQPAESAAPAAPSNSPAPTAGQPPASSNDTPVIKVDDNPPPATPVN